MVWDINLEGGGRESFVFLQQGVGGVVCGLCAHGDKAVRCCYTEYTGQRVNGWKDAGGADSDCGWDYFFKKQISRN